MNNTSYCYYIAQRKMCSRLTLPVQIGVFGGENDMRSCLLIIHDFETQSAT